MRAFIDTNILISFIDANRDNHKNVKKLLMDLFANGDKIIFSEDILTNVIYNLKDHREESVYYFKKLNNDIEHFEIVSFGKNTINKACDFYLEQKIFTNKGDFEDTLQYFCALENRCERIYTNDRSNFPQLKIALYDSQNKPFFDPR